MKLPPLPTELPALKAHIEGLLYELAMPLSDQIYVMVQGHLDFIARHITDIHGINQCNDTWWFVTNNEEGVPGLYEGAPAFIAHYDLTIWADPNYAELAAKIQPHGATEQVRHRLHQLDGLLTIIIDSGYLDIRCLTVTKPKKGKAHAASGTRKR